MLTLRFAAAFWTLYATVALRRSFTKPEILRLLDELPELSLAALVLEMLPTIVAVASIVRWLRARPAERRGAFAAATRLAAILSVVGLLLPFHAGESLYVDAVLAYRAGQLVALLFMLDGPLFPEE